MKPFIFKQATGVWPAGETLLHVYVLPDLARDQRLKTLVDGCRATLTDFPISPIEDQWLHVTIDQVTDRVGGEIDAVQRAVLVAALTDRLRTVAPFELTVGSALSYPSGVIFDLGPDDPLVALHEVVRETIRQVRGDDAVRYPWSVQHLTLAYAHAEASSDDVQWRLRRVRPSHAPMHVDAVHVVDVRADAVAKTITWDPVAAVPLAG